MLEGRKMGKGDKAAFAGAAVAGAILMVGGLPLLGGIIGGSLLAAAGVVIVGGTVAAAAALGIVVVKGAWDIGKGLKHDLTKMRQQQLEKGPKTAGVEMTAEREQAEPVTPTHKRETDRSQRAVQERQRATATKPGIRASLRGETGKSDFRMRQVQDASQPAGPENTAKHAAHRLGSFREPGGGHLGLMGSRGVKSKPKGR